MAKTRARLVDRFEHAMTKCPENTEEIRMIVLEAIKGIPDTFSDVSMADVIAYAVVNYLDAKRRVIRNQEEVE